MFNGSFALEAAVYMYPYVWKESFLKADSRGGECCVKVKMTNSGA